MTRTQAVEVIGKTRIVFDGAKYLIEQFSWCNLPKPIWAVPAWDEMGYPKLMGPFKSKWAAAVALSETDWA